MHIIGAIGGKKGGIPVIIAENKGVINPVATAVGKDTKNPTVAIGKYIGKKTDPSPIKWNNTGITTPRALKIAAITISLLLIVTFLKDLSI